ncbi:MAG: polyprenyl diphosphate synthase [Oscillospiraceae bacterium]|nr:polyprenyl diphosphate synthase [Oscillospiraceae bacterium]
MINKSESFPRHVGIIMDGNGRWASRRGLPRSAGHTAGAQTFKRLSEYFLDLGTETVTFYAFSTENKGRPQDEVRGISKLFFEYLEEWFTMSKDKNMRIRFLGDRSFFDTKTIELMNRVEKDSAVYENQMNIAVNYGSRAEICRAFNILSQKLRTGELSPGAITENNIEGALYTAGQPDVDLLIRTGAEKRISNFLLWQSAYAELYFTDKLWPDMTKADIDAAMEFFATRKRRFGKLK